MVLYTVDLSAPGASREAIRKGFKEPGDEVGVILARDKHVDGNVLYLKKAWLECIPYFQKKFDSGPTLPPVGNEKSSDEMVIDLTGSSQAASETSDDESFTEQGSVQSWVMVTPEPSEDAHSSSDPAAESALSMANPTIELADFSALEFEKFLVPWLHRGIPNPEGLRLNIYAWATVLRLVDFLQITRIAPDVARALSNEVTRSFFRSASKDIEAADGPWHKYPVAAYRELQNLPARFIIVHGYWMAIMYGGKKPMFELPLGKIPNELEALQTQGLQFVRDLAQWQLALPPFPDRCDCANMKHVWNQPEELACPIDSILIPLLFAEEPLPAWYRPSFVKPGEDVRQSVRNHLGMSLN